VQVETTSRHGTVAAFGDSLTHGPAARAPSPAATDEGYPDVLTRRLLEAGRPLAVVNRGIAGNRLLPQALDRLLEDVVAEPRASTAIVLLGTNDIGAGTPVSEIIAGYELLLGVLRDAGIPVLVGTVPPFVGFEFGSYGQAGEPDRLLLNGWLRDGAPADGVVDFDAAVRDPARPDRLLPRYDSGDHLHLSRAGYRAMADAVPLDQLVDAGC
jgi:lysophospholipase L1-like esterase